MSTQTPTPEIEDRLRALYRAQAGAVVIPPRPAVDDLDTTTVADVVSLDARRRRAARTWTVITALTTAAAVVAGLIVVALSDKDDGKSVMVTTQWGYPVRLEPGAFTQFDFASVPDGYARAVHNDVPDAAVCTKWTAGADEIACPRAHGVAAASYEHGDSTLSLVTVNDPEDVFGELVAGETKGARKVTVRGRQGWLASHDEDGDLTTELIWRERDAVVIQIMSYGPRNQRTREAQVLALAADLRELSEPAIRLGLEVGRGRILGDDVASGAPEVVPVIVGIGGTVEAPCVISYAFTCTPLEREAGEPFAVEERDVLSAVLSAPIVGAVDTPITTVRLDTDGPSVEAKTITLPGQQSRFFVLQPPNGSVPDALVFLDADGFEVARHTVAAAPRTTDTPASDPPADESTPAEENAVFAHGTTNTGVPWQLIASKTVESGSPLFRLELDHSVTVDDTTYGGPVLVRGGQLWSDTEGFATLTADRLYVIAVPRSVMRVEFDPDPNGDMTEENVPEWLDARVFTVELGPDVPGGVITAYGENLDVVVKQRLQVIVGTDSRRPAEIEATTLVPAP